MNTHNGAVLIVADSPVLSLQLQRQLHTLDVMTVPVEASDVSLHAGGARLAIVDVQLLQGNGFAVVRELAGASCPVVLTSGTGRNTDMHWGMGAGAIAVLTRPVSSARLQQVLERLAFPLPASGEL